MAKRHVLRRVLEIPVKPRMVTVVGTFRCGTNYLAKMLLDNTRLTVRYDTFGWKHGPLSAEGHKPFPGTMPHRIVSVSKDPFSFLVSFHSYCLRQRRNVIAADDWAGFVTGPIEIFNQGAAGAVRFRFPSPVAYWNFLNAHHLLLPADTFRLCLVRYDDLLRDSEGTARRLLADLSITPRTETLILPQSRVAASQDSARSLRNAESEGETFDPSVHLSRAYMRHFDDRLFDYVINALDTDLVSQLGYDDVIRDLADIHQKAKDSRR